MSQETQAPSRTCMEPVHRVAGEGLLLAIVARGQHEHQAIVLWASDAELDQDAWDFDGDPYGCGMTRPPGAGLWVWTATGLRPEPAPESPERKRWLEDSYQSVRWERLPVEDHVERVRLGKWAELGAQLLWARLDADFDDAPTMEVAP